ncbi:uncharacterized protein LOC127007042 [Eriocheir sinensis]|uniref:uncharacterized protein LOC127007042 n=1 Tax=Eriocheir sinensis TaxID=95602 RepID=UPI0021CA5821|nr:uncharacterized protein LOC127007042 [Eriocheir sinensis]
MQKITELEPSLTYRPLRDSPGHCAEKTAKAKSTSQEFAVNSSTSAEKNRVTHKAQSAEWDFHGFTSSESSTTSPLKRKNADADMSAISEHKICTMKSSEDQNGGPQPAGSSPENSKSNNYSVAIARWLEAHCYKNKASGFSNENLSNTPCMKKGSCDKCQVDIKKTRQPENNVRDGNCEQKKNSASKITKLSEIIKPNDCRTYSGPIQRRVVNMKEGGKRTIMIVKKESLKNLQAKGLIQPIRKYVPHQPSASQSLQETNNQFSSESTKHLVGHTSENLSSRKGDALVWKDSSIVCEGQEPSTESSSDQCAYSNSSTQTCNLLKTIKGLQAPVTVSCADVNGSDSQSIKFTVQLLGGGNKSSGTNLPQHQTASSNSGPLFTVSQPRTQTRALVDSKQPSSNSITSSNSEVDHLQISPEENRSTGGCSVLGSVSLDEDMSFEIAQDKGTGLPSKDSTEVNCSDSRTIGIEGDTVGDKPSKTRPQKRDNVQWIAMPSSGTAVKEEQTDSHSKKLPTIALTSSEKPGVIYKAIPVESLLQTGQKLHITPSYKSANKELKVKYARLLKKHRYRYHMLLKKYTALQQTCAELSEPGTPQQFIKDAHKFLSKEHVLFLESQMFLRNRAGSGNRFSRNFMKLMIEYYKRSPAGYRYLKTIFTVPSVPTVQKWMNRSFEFGDLYGNAPEDNSNEADPPPKSKVSDTSQNSNSNQKKVSKKKTVENMECEEGSSDSDNSEDCSLKVTVS